MLAYRPGSSDIHDALGLLDTPIGDQPDLSLCRLRIDVYDHAFRYCHARRYPFADQRGIEVESPIHLPAARFAQERLSVGSVAQGASADLGKV